MELNWIVAFRSRSSLRSYTCLAIMMSSAVASTGCTFDSDRWKRLDLGVEATAPAGASSASHRDTIGASAFYEGMAAMRVSGYGLVVGLGRNGSTDCPKRIFDRLVQDIEKQFRSGPTLVGSTRITPGQLIRDPDTAVVMVRGDIMPGTTTGTHFDVAVSAIPGTDARSLRGGRLYTCELDYSVATSPDRVRHSGRTLALAAGPVFLNPFAFDDDAATTSNPLEGYTIGGGVVTQDRRVRLVLTEPSYSRAVQVERRINAKYPGQAKVADAISPSFIKIRIPKESHGDTEHFLLLLRHLFLPQRPGFVADRCRELATEIVRPDAPHGAIALCLEGIGPAALPTLGSLYSHHRDYVSFHAAAAGLRLEDHVAVEVMALHAADPDSPFRFQAVRALGRASKMGTAATPLRRLLDDEDPRVRVAAYEELARRHDMSLQTTTVGGDNFLLEVVQTSRRPMIYAKRSGERRIVVFGTELNCITPVFYMSVDGALTINAADPNDTKLTLVRKSPLSGSVSPPIPCSRDVLDMIELIGGEPEEHNGTVTGLGLDYGSIVHVLHTLCNDNVINADFILEEENAAELFGPARRNRRPESEL